MSDKNISLKITDKEDEKDEIIKELKDEIEKLTLLYEILNKRYNELLFNYGELEKDLYRLKYFN